MLQTGRLGFCVIGLAAVACCRYKWRWAKDSAGRRSLLSAAVNALDKQLGPEKVQVRDRAASILQGGNSSSAGEQAYCRVTKEQRKGASILHGFTAAALGVKSSSAGCQKQQC